eukprot:1658069-Pleurochrysis_carterae.AAC.2
MPVKNIAICTPDRAGAVLIKTTKTTERTRDLGADNVRRGSGALQDQHMHASGVDEGRPRAGADSASRQQGAGRRGEGWHVHAGLRGDGGGLELGPAR